ncbi:hypothetical protein Cgig2_015912 [Carnegiea gigantea]|uniref:Reverse transcriptase zinc-binding domain-containing protein n=1 Tax=Carnegiea gigantea TaxID=171969 RepID=A0A9Q1GT86_9CARY|nr:hypothetical protein Cgig2_015912 [Carnegiea gigantea]
MFADDLLLFYKADPPTIRHIMSALALLHKCAGLKANLAKSQMVMGGCNAQLQQQCLQLTEEEADKHVLFSCPYAQEVWQGLNAWWQSPVNQASHNLTTYLLAVKGPKAQKSITFAIYAASIYYLWYARNKRIFQSKNIPSSQTIRIIKEQLINHNESMVRFLSSSVMKNSHVFMVDPNEGNAL